MDALEEEQEKQARILGMRRLPDDLERLPPTDREGTYRQVNLNCPPDDFKLLDQLARAYSVSPTTMARMLVARGVRRLSQQG